MTVEISGQKKLFNLAEANLLLPLVTKLTQSHCDALAPLQLRLDRMLSNDPRRTVFEQQYQTHVSQWRGKIERLGATAAGLWVVEFEVGDGALNWRYPELQIAYFRPQRATIRQKLLDYIEENDPDWAW